MTTYKNKIILTAINYFAIVFLKTKRVSILKINR